MAESLSNQLSEGEAESGVLAGPILRRADRDGVCVWIATESRIRASLVVYRAGREHEGLLGAGDAETIRLGDRLFVHLLTARPEAGRFPVDELLTYDVRFGSSASGATLADCGLVWGPASLAYRGFSLPSFFLREAAGPLHVLHGSCRKLHGKGHDALLCADELLERTSGDPSGRPSALFLTGDQFYADDVAPALIQFLHRLGRDLTGREETIPGIPPVCVSGVGGRARWIHDVAGFTSPHADNHLMTFGELAAAYLLAMSDASWPANTTELAELAVQSAPHMGRLARRRLRGQVADLENARAALPAVRRVVANVPTFVIFDDHDVTDDWNLTKRWRDRVSSSPAGRRVVANALAAFWAFHGWGNDPGLFDREFKDAIEAHLARDDEAAAENFDRVLWDFDRWSFSAPTKPPSICLDTRTQRGYDGEEGAARLIGARGFDRIAELVHASGYVETDPLLVVSATPVCGLELHERRQKFFADQVGPYAVDFEGWHSSLHGLVDFMTFLTKRLGLQSAVVLSGDVHYGLTVDVRFTVDEATVHVGQLVSSGLKHSGLITQEFLNVLGRLNRNRHERVGWASPPQLPADARLTRRFLQRPVNTDEWDKDAPVFLSPAVAHALRIDQAPDYREVRTYIHPQGPSPSALIGENNIGWVIVDGHTVTHRLLSRGDNTTMHEATIDLTPGSEAR